MIQFSLISLIPGLINYLEDCADPAFDNYAQTVEKPTSLKTSDRTSCMFKRGLEMEGKCTDYGSIGIYGTSVADLWKGMCCLSFAPQKAKS
jgi:hypothetical protein